MIQVQNNQERTKVGSESCSEKLSQNSQPNPILGFFFSALVHIQVVDLDEELFHIYIFGNFPNFPEICSFFKTPLNFF